MKLYLSSMGPSNSEQLIGLIGKTKNLKAAIVPNAWDTDSKKRRELESNNCIAALGKFGFSCSVLDLRHENGQTISDTLSAKDLVWIMGGNTFYLNYVINKSGFNKAITGLLRNGLVYGGESAGAVVAGVTLHGIEFLDDPDQAPEVIWDGLKFLTFGVIPHWGQDKYGTALIQSKEEMSKYTRVATIENNQALVIDGEELEVVTNPLI